MPNNQVYILIAEQDPQISSFLAEQTLKPLEFQVVIEFDSNSALKRLLTYQFDVVLANIDLPGLSGTDLLIALRAQGLDIPVIMIAQPGQESKVIHAYRLGAADSLFWPFREAEVVSVLQRVLGQYKSLQSSAATLSEIEQSNQALQQKIRDLTDLHRIGLAAVTIHDPKNAFVKILSGAVKLSGADFAWLQKYDQASHKQYLVGHHKLPDQFEAELNKPWNRDIGSKVATTGEPLHIFEGEIRASFLYPLANSVLVLPLKEKGTVIGMFAVAKNDQKPFSASDQKLLEIVAGYTSLAFTNLQLYQNLREQNLALQTQLASTEFDLQIAKELLQQTALEFRMISEPVVTQINQLLDKPDALNASQLEQVTNLLASFEQTKFSLNLLPVEEPPVIGAHQFDLVQLLHQRVKLFADIARVKKIDFIPGPIGPPVSVFSNETHISATIDALLSYALKNSLPDGAITIGTDLQADDFTHVEIRALGLNTTAKTLDRLVNEQDSPQPNPEQIFAGIAVPLKLVEQLIKFNNGSIWFENSHGEGGTFHLLLPRSPFIS